MKKNNLQPKQKAIVVRGEQSTLTSPELSKLSLSELGNVSEGFSDFCDRLGGCS